MSTRKLNSRGIFFPPYRRFVARCLAQFEKLEMGIIPTVQSAIGGQFTDLEKAHLPIPQGQGREESLWNSREYGMIRLRGTSEGSDCPASCSRIHPI